MPFLVRAPVDGVRRLVCAERLVLVEGELHGGRVDRGVDAEEPRAQVGPLAHERQDVAVRQRGEHVTRPEALACGPAPLERGDPRRAQGAGLEDDVRQAADTVTSLLGEPR